MFGTLNGLDNIYQALLELKMENEVSYGMLCMYM